MSDKHEDTRDKESVPPFASKAYWRHRLTAIAIGARDSDRKARREIVSVALLIPAVVALWRPANRIINAFIDQREAESKATVTALKTITETQVSMKDSLDEVVTSQRTLNKVIVEALSGVDPVDLKPKLEGHRRKK